MTQPNFIDETGKKYGKLTVIAREQNTIYGTAQWLCKCECGNTKIIRGQNLRSGRITHCGCENKSKKITNYFRIKNMSINEMAEFLCKGHNCKNLCAFYVDNNSCVDIYKDCKDGIKQWLLQEVAE